jgi:hypothetical protein
VAQRQHCTHFALPSKNGHKSRSFARHYFRCCPAHPKRDLEVEHRGGGGRELRPGSTSDSREKFAIGSTSFCWLCKVLK